MIRKLFAFCLYISCRSYLLSFVLFTRIERRYKNQQLYVQPTISFGNIGDIVEQTTLRSKLAELLCWRCLDILESKLLSSSVVKYHWWIGFKSWFFENKLPKQLADQPLDFLLNIIIAEAASYEYIKVPLFQIVESRIDYNSTYLFYPADIANTLVSVKGEVIEEFFAVGQVLQLENTEILKFADTFYLEGEVAARRSRQSIFNVTFAESDSKAKRDVIQSVDMVFTNFAIIQLMSVSDDPTVDEITTLFRGSDDSSLVGSARNSYLAQFVENISYSKSLAQLLQIKSNKANSSKKPTDSMDNGYPFRLLLTAGTNRAEKVSPSDGAEQGSIHEPGSPRHLLERLIVQAISQETRLPTFPSKFLNYSDVQMKSVESLYDMRSREVRIDGEGEQATADSDDRTSPSFERFKEQYDLRRSRSESPSQARKGPDRRRNHSVFDNQQIVSRIVFDEDIDMDDLYDDQYDDNEVEDAADHSAAFPPQPIEASEEVVESSRRPIDTGLGPLYLAKELLGLRYRYFTAFQSSLAELQESFRLQYQPLWQEKIRERKQFDRSNYLREAMGYGFNAQRLQREEEALIEAQRLQIEQLLDDHQSSQLRLSGADLLFLDTNLNISLIRSKTVIDVNVTLSNLKTCNALGGPIDGAGTAGMQSDDDLDDEDAIPMAAGLTGSTGVGTSDAWSDGLQDGAKGWRVFEDPSETETKSVGKRQGLGVSVMDPPNGLKPPGRVSTDDDDESQQKEAEEEDLRKPVDFGDIEYVNSMDWLDSSNYSVVRVIDYKSDEDDSSLKYLCLEAKKSSGAVVRKWVKYDVGIEYLLGSSQSVDPPSDSFETDQTNKTRNPSEGEEAGSLQGSDPSSLSDTITQIVQNNQTNDESSPFYGGRVPML